MNVEAIRLLVVMAELILSSTDPTSPRDERLLLELDALHGTLERASRSLNPEAGGVAYHETARGEAVMRAKELKRALDQT